MSKTIVDMPKVCQMLDAGWRVRIYKGPMGSYEVRASHETRMPQVQKVLVEEMRNNCQEFMRNMNMTADEAAQYMHFDDDNELMTDDFTPEQALTRMAYKVFGEIL